MSQALLTRWLGQHHVSMGHGAARMGPNVLVQVTLQAAQSGSFEQSLKTRIWSGHSSRPVGNKTFGPRAVNMQLASCQGRLPGATKITLQNPSRVCPGHRVQHKRTGNSALRQTRIQAEDASYQNGSGRSDASVIRVLVGRNALRLRI